MAKTVTPAGAPGGAGAACAAGYLTLLFNQKVLAAQKPMTYTDLLQPVYFSNLYPSPIVNNMFMFFE